ncbi:LysR family transcriptional regulator [Streptomyces sp. NPDC021020]|uniref:LysR family transcriptional regulator n=1 Tax=Streptomyces sp. NPDC021020 TaxID=3365109 RepID=UPI00378C8F0A
MELRQIRYFVAVAEDLHFGRAAERLVIAQSAVSTQIRRLERELGVELFDRSPRHVRLSEAGQEFLPAAREVLDAARRASGAVERFVADRGATLRVGTSTGMGERLDQVLEVLQRESPGTAVELFSGPLDVRLARVAAGEWDAAFARGEVDVPEGVRLLPLWQDELVAALPAGHALAGRGTLPLTELAGLPLLLTERRNNPPLVDLVVGACHDAGFEPVPGRSHGSLQDNLASLGAGRSAWTVVYASHAAQLRHSRVAFVHVTDPAGHRLALPGVLVVRRETPAHRLRPLLDACRTVARGDSGRGDGPGPGDPRPGDLDPR